MASAQQAQAPAGPVGKLKHIVVIFQENVSFDHYFGTYPQALNPPGEPRFVALAGTPAVAGLSQELLTHNGNFTNRENGANAANPFRLDRSQAATADQHHEYHAEQLAFDHGRMDLFPRYTGRNGPPPGAAGVTPGDPPITTQGLVMGYYDGNTVTALWNYAQHYAMSDHSFGTTFGPSTVGAINLVSGQTNGVVKAEGGRGALVDGGAGSISDIADPNPLHDVCSSSNGARIALGGPNIGNLLTTAKVTWGWFQGGFDLETVNLDRSTGCLRAHYSEIVGRNEHDYVPHHEPFQYYLSTANPEHLRPTSVATIGHNGDRGRHQYDLEDFFAAVKAGNFPAVSFLKAMAFQNGHAGNSDPLDEQHFLVRVINFLEQRPEWDSTAVIIAYDDSDGWYDHLASPIVNGSRSSEDGYDAAGVCGAQAPQLPGMDAGNLHAEGRCGYGPRLPLLVISPWARPNFVAHNVTDQTSILRLIEDTFLHGQRLGQGSFDKLSGALDPLFDFSAGAPRNPQRLLLDAQSGEIRGPK
ncbi:MAG TPA: alkaline phosphatase family protein [Terriglobales bacterium]|nr:alkaline phosphatase family protein [Terriglobales bacterium]